VRLLLRVDLTLGDRPARSEPCPTDNLKIRMKWERDDDPRARLVQRQLAAAAGGTRMLHHRRRPSSSIRQRGPASDRHRWVAPP
jgi:hypothetical protein